MLFIHIGLLAGLAAVVVPIAIHLWSQRRRERVAWAAVRFLRRSVDVRKRKVELEDALLMATRCLLVALVALAVARPFIPDGSRVPWALILPMGIAAICGLGVTVAVWSNKSLRLVLIPLTLVALLICGGLLLLERNLNEKRLGAAGKQDIAVIIDASMSMTAGAESGNFATAIKEARGLGTSADGGDPVAMILAGTVPEEMTNGLVRDRSAIEESLSKAQPSSGSMAALAAVERAVAVLAEGTQTGKKIVMFTDGQASGWQLDQPELWQALDERLAEMPSPPQLILRQFEFPTPFRNAAIASIEFIPEMIMVNQTGTITVTIENTGEQAITPNALEVQVDGALLPTLPMDQIAPGELRPVAIPYPFNSAGPVTVTAELITADDLEGDNRAAAVGFVRSALQVLVVDGRPEATGLDRPSAFFALALGSSSPTRRGIQIDPQLVTLAEFENRESLEGVGAVALCEVDQLPGIIATRLANFVSGGGGLIVVPGESPDIGFYNTWRHKAEFVLPAEIGIQQQFSMIEDKLGPQASSFQRTMFKFLADDEQSDISAMLVARYRKLLQHPEAEELGRLRNGDPLFLRRKIGDGEVFLSAIGFRPGSSNLVTREVFLPIVHELVFGIAGASGFDLALDPAPGMELNLPLTDQLDGELPEQASITAASGDQLTARLRATPGGFSASWNWDGISGMHDLNLPPEIASRLPNGMVDADGALRFSVGRDIDESRKRLLTDGDREVIGDHLDLIEANSLADVQSVLAGQPVGEELWRKLLIAALVLLVLESLLTRYITRQRKVGQQSSVRFGTPELKVAGGGQTR